MGIKYPGRVGDSPVAGAGFYADDRYGAATCTGTGEMAIRAATAHSVVFAMQMGATLLEAGTRAMAEPQRPWGPLPGRHGLRGDRPRRQPRRLQQLRDRDLHPYGRVNGRARALASHVRGDRTAMG